MDTENPDGFFAAEFVSFFGGRAFILSKCSRVSRLFGRLLFGGFFQKNNSAGLDVNNEVCGAWILAFAIGMLQLVQVNQTSMYSIERGTVFKYSWHMN